MKRTLAVIVLVALIHCTKSQVSSERIRIKSGHPSLCFDESQGRYYNNGDVWDYPDVCDRHTCRAAVGQAYASTYNEYCDLDINPFNCPVVENRSLSFPDCCPKHRCPEDEPPARCDGLNIDATLDLECDLAGRTVNCSGPSLAGTVVFMACASGYIPLQRYGYDNITCNVHGAWSKSLIKCVPDCGRQNDVGGQEFISNGQNVQVGDFAWHVAIYELNQTQQYEQVCGGSIISTRLILSAAHCFWELSHDKSQDKSLYTVAAGKYSLDWYTDDPHIQRRNLSEIITHPLFIGRTGLLAYDIAVVRVDVDIKLSLYVNTVCLNFDRRFEERQLIRGENGSVAGFGVTELNEQSQVLKSANLPYIPAVDCKHIVELKFRKYLTPDKICGGFVGKGVNVCPGDSGGGFVFPQSYPQGTRYFLRGVVSVGHRPPPNTGIKCLINQVSAFTKVSVYSEWIDNIVFQNK